MRSMTQGKNTDNIGWHKDTVSNTTDYPKQGEDTDITTQVRAPW